MKNKFFALIVLALFGIFLIPSQLAAYPNLILNGDFENGLNNWTTKGDVIVANLLGAGFASPSGDGSNFARLAVNDIYPNNATLQQIVDMTASSMYRLSLDFTIATFEQGWGDDFRAELWVNYPGGGTFTPMFSYGSGSGVFTSWDPVNYPGLKYYTVQGFTYDFMWPDASDNLVLDFHVLGYSYDEYSSAMLVDNVSLTAVPEPGTISLLILGMGLSAIGVRRRKK